MTLEDEIENWAEENSAEGNRADTAKFFDLALAEFPELRDDFADDDGLFHLQIATFSRVAQKAIESGDFLTLKRCYAIVDEVMKDASPYVENAVYVSFLEHLEFEILPNGKEARRLLPPKLAEMLVELEAHFQKMWEAQQADRFK